ncbi:MAG: thiamine-phosphate kinase [Anaeromyxobacter sp.]
MTEFELISRFTSRLPLDGEGVRLGVGDDAALLRPPAGEVLVTTVDMVVEGVHFDDRFTPADVGWKALAVNLSDLAAMGARPLWALVSLALPPGIAPARLDGLAQGLAACARPHAVAVVGGNVSRARELSVAVTVIGSVPEKLALTRGGARPGDLLLASGSFGGAALGLRPRASAALARRQRRPEPRVALGRALAGVARAAIDVSDGLVQDLEHLCDASGVGAVVDVRRVPVDAAVRRAARGLPDPDQPALAGGEDYELLVAVPPEKLPDAGEAARQAGVPLTVIGQFTEGGDVTLLDAAGQPRALPAGHDHLRPPRGRERPAGAPLTSPPGRLGSGPTRRRPGRAISRQRGRRGSSQR